MGLRETQWWPVGKLHHIVAQNLAAVLDELLDLVFGDPLLFAALCRYMVWSYWGTIYAYDCSVSNQLTCLSSLDSSSSSLLAAALDVLTNPVLGNILLIRWCLLR